MRLVQISTIILIFVAAIIGQTNRGGISGTVADSNGAIIPNATVTITNLRTNQKITLTTSENGSYTANSLEPVEYSILAEAPGFKKSIKLTVRGSPA